MSSVGFLVPESVVEAGFADFEARCGLSDGQSVADVGFCLLEFFGCDDRLAPSLSAARGGGLNPACVRSTMRSRSNWASAPNKWNTNVPPHEQGRIAIRTHSLSDVAATLTQTLAAPKFVDLDTVNPFQAFRRIKRQVFPETSPDNLDREWKPLVISRRRD